MSERKKRIGTVLIFAIPTIYLLIMIKCALNRSIWTDEAFSLQMIRYGYGKMVGLTAQDVHPPLYYFILKFAVDMIHVFLPDASSVMIGKITSSVPFFILIIFSGWKLKKEYGSKFAIVFDILLLSMPHMLQYAVEIRMYSWAMLFVFAAFYNFMNILCNETSVKRNWICLTIFSLAAAYTHYFAAVAAAELFLCMFIWSLIRHDKTTMIKEAIVAVCGVGLYFPWLIVLHAQMSQIHHNYWISKPGFSDIQKIIKYPVNPEGNLNISRLIYVILFLLILCSIVYVIYKKNNRLEILMIRCNGFLMLIFVETVGITVSLCYQPIFIARYLLPAFVCMDFSFAYLISQQNKKMMLCWGGILMLLLLYDPRLYWKNELSNDWNYEQCEKLIENADGHIIISDYLNAASVFALDENMDIYITQQFDNSVYYKVFQNIHPAKDLQEDISRENLIFFYQDDLNDIKKLMDQYSVDRSKAENKYLKYTHGFKAVYIKAE